jgi:hypothetical protein
MSLLELAHRRKAARPALSVPVNTDPLSSPSPLLLANPQSDSDATLNPFIGPSSSYMIPSTERLKNFGKHALKHIKLSDESQAEFHQYIEV